MSQCLRDSALLLLDDGEGGDEQWSHVESCKACGQRYYQLTRDLDLIRHTLRQEPPPLRSYASRMPFSYRWMPAAAALLLAIGLIWGESRVWRANSLSDQAFNSDLSQFLDQVSDAIFTGGSVREAGAASPDSDFLQAALEETCSDECQELFSNSAEGTAASASDETAERNGQHRPAGSTE